MGLEEVVRSLITVVIFVGMLFVLVVIHELGHFVAARLAGVRVHEFGIGFPPRAKVISDRGETLYTLNWLPIGGFVRLEGEDGDDSGDPRSFASARLPIKLGILLAGVAMNVVLAFAILAGISATGEPTVGVRVGAVQAESPAAVAGVRDGDVITTLDGRAYSFFGDDGFILDDLKAAAGRTVVLGIERDDGSTTTVSATLRPADQIDAQHGALGIERNALVSARATVARALPDAIGLGVRRTGEAMGLILGGLAQLGDSIVNRPTEAPPAAGPVGIAMQVGDVFWQLGPLVTLYLAAILSANLAVVNALPFPPLDGGRILFVVLRAFAGRRISIRAERLTYLVGFVFLFAFLIWITGFDIARSLGG